MAQEARSRTLFDAVAGHKDRIFTGKPTTDGRPTIVKTTTAWEVMHHLAMVLGVPVATAMCAGDFPALSQQTRASFLLYAKRIAGLCAFTPELVSIGVPREWCTTAAELTWLNVADTQSQTELVALLLNLYTGAAIVTAASRYDAQLWSIALVDLTAGFAQPCVMDVKIGRLRYTKITPQPKVDKITRKDEGSILRKCGLRVSGFKRWYRPEPVQGSGSGATDFSVERHGKPFGHALDTTALICQYLRAFFTSQHPLATTGPVANNAVSLIPRDSVVESPAELSRLAAAHTTVQQLAAFFRDPDSGGALLGDVAFVACSLLCVYDAQGDGSSCNVSLIDLAMSTPRSLNYDEQEVGFMDGLESMEAYLSQP